MTTAVYLNALGLICALGNDVAQVRQALFSSQPPALPAHEAIVPGKSFPVARVSAGLASVDALLPQLRSRNNAILLTALAQIRDEVDAVIARFGPARVAIVLGTSTSGIFESENAIRAFQQTGKVPAQFHPSQQEMGSPAMALQQVLGIHGPAYAISTACSSGAKALASAARLLRMDLADAVIAGAVDSLCGFTVAGFASLDSVSASGCAPLMPERDGIHIGEGAALFLVTREHGPVRLAGVGESSDAHHISAPAPDGSGARAAMEQALERANRTPADIDYINLHGTATEQNDAMESIAVSALFGTAASISPTPVSSTKHSTGHTLGAAGAVEAGICWIVLHENPEGALPPNWPCRAPDPALPPLFPVPPGFVLERAPRAVLSNSFAFGGSNAALVLERA
ncbi:MAG: beta-ketoacyl-ACP synthase [Lysobacteraceae bacterium]